MSKSHSSVVAIIEQLYAARHALAEAYERREVELTEQNEAKVMPLLATHLMIKTSHDRARIVTDLKRLLDVALRKQGIISVSTELGAEMNAMDLELVQLQGYEGQGDHHGIEHSLGEIQDRLYAIFDMLNTSTFQLHARVAMGFGTSSNAQLRHKENEYYLTELERLIDSFQRIRKGFEREAYQESSVRGLIYNIEAKCLGVIDRIRQIQDVIREHIFKHRELEARGLRLRALARFVRDRPAWQPERAALIPEQHSAFRRPKEILSTVSIYPDLRVNKVMDALIPLVNQLQRQIKADVAPFKRDVSAISQAVPIREVSMIPVCEQAFRTLFINIVQNKSAISADDYWGSASLNAQGIPRDYWLYFLLNHLQPGRTIKNQAIERFVKTQLILSPRATFSNRSLDDIVLYSPSAPDAVVNACIHHHTMTQKADAPC